ncbi:hypothetical protein JQ621_00555 [Bradyrhizobium manausense]|uniref:hypothetical protein n=1 Tax=Bradyrhizobium manausense TaxID=989370 RepID=UPI001BACEAE7|nr:hypothetical protein [Bradyrhizobium manausense]MBR1085961.1 hypothetical protein [Bradyrhizobium manausense]
MFVIELDRAPKQFENSNVSKCPRDRDFRMQLTRLAGELGQPAGDAHGSHVPGSGAQNGALEMDVRPALRDLIGARREAAGRKNSHAEIEVLRQMEAEMPSSRVARSSSLI